MSERLYGQSAKSGQEIPRNPLARSYRELIVYQKQRELARRVFAYSESFPKSERFALTDQLRRASRSIGAQIAEAWAKRDYPKHFVSKLSDADGEQQETQHWLETASDCSYLPPETEKELLGLCEEIGRMLHSMKVRAHNFCSSSHRVLEQSDEAFMTAPLSTEH